MNKSFKVIALSMLLSLSATGFAQTPSDKSLNEFAKVIQFDETFKEGMRAGFLSSVELDIKSDPNFQQLSPNEQQKIYAISETYANKILAEINTNELKTVMLDEFNKVAKRHYTQAEINAMIKFYGSPIGQKIVTKQNVMMNEFMGNVSQILLDPTHPISQKIATVSEKYSTELSEEIDKILNH